MGSRSGNSLNERLLATRTAWENWRADWKQWKQDVRDDPAVLFRTPGVRIGLLLAFGLLGLWGARVLSRSIVSPELLGADARPTRVATLYVACATGCGYFEPISRPMDFKDWPMTCPKCSEKDVYRAKPCGRCRGWYAVRPGATDDGCPICRRAAQPKASAPVQSQPTDPHDREDGW